MRNTILAGAAAGALALLFAAPAAAAGHDILDVPDAFDSQLSDTRANGEYWLEGTALHLATDRNGGTPTSQNKVAEYVLSETRLDEVGETGLDYSVVSGIAPGYQLVVDLDADGDADGILVGEPSAYGDVWWLGGHADFGIAIPAGTVAPTGNGTGYPYDGTIEQWLAVYPDAVVTAFGFSLGSGTASEGVLHSITFDGTTYVFGAVLSSKEECKSGGWKSSTAPVFKNQGDCVSSFRR